MDFFEHQDRARARSRALLGLFSLCVALIVAAVYLSVLLALYYFDRENNTAYFWAVLSPGGFLGISGVVLSQISLAAAFEFTRIGGKGGAIARALGGEEVVNGELDLDRKRLWNVVEEMAIASGVPVPEVYVIPNEPSINAFAAGSDWNSAAIGVTSGALKEFTRDELQAVIAHEFSHIFNGDARLNTRLIAGIFGISLISGLGSILIRSVVRSGRGMRKRGGALPVLVLGGLLWLVGSIGILFSRLIQSAVSRQREFLADASAVQFTRNPSGILAALRRIQEQGTAPLNNAYGPDCAHLFFASVVPSSWVATHPPLSERINRIRTLGGEFPTSRSTLSRVGTLDVESMAFAERLIGAWEGPIQDVLASPFGSMDLIAEVILRASDRDGGAGMTARKPISPISMELDRIGRESWFPLVTVGASRVRKLSYADRRQFWERVKSAIQADGKLSRFEFGLALVLRSILFPRPMTPLTPAEIENLPLDGARILKFAATGGADPVRNRAAYEAGARLWDESTLPQFEPLAMALSEVRASLERLCRMAPKRKKELLQALLVVMTLDESNGSEEVARLSTSEIDLLRALALMLNCPIPAGGESATVAQQTPQAS